MAASASDFAGFSSIDLSSPSISFACGNNSSSSSGTRPVQTTRLPTPFPGGYESEPMMVYSNDVSMDDVSDNESEGSCYSVYSEGSDCSVSSSDSSDSEFDDGCPPSLFFARCSDYGNSGRTYVSEAQATEIRFFHSLELTSLQMQQFESNPIVRFRGASPNWSYVPSPETSGSATPTSEVPSGPMSVVNGPVEASSPPWSDERSYYDAAYSNFVAAHDEFFVLSPASEARQQPVPDFDTWLKQSKASAALIDHSYDYPDSCTATPVACQQPDVEMTDATIFDDIIFDTLEQQHEVSETFTDPYGMPKGVPKLIRGAFVRCNESPRIYDFASFVLENSGVNVIIDYPVSTSPRLPAQHITALLKGVSEYYRDTKEVGCEIVHKADTCVSKRDLCFTPFSYTNLRQPRTMIHRQIEGGDEPVSPKTVLMV